MGKCSFNASWLFKDDGCGCKVSEWAKKETENSVICLLCECSVNINKGFQALVQHAATKKHEQLRNLKLNPLQLRLSEENADNGKAHIWLCSQKDLATRAELIWVMKSSVSNYSSLSCSGIAEVFKAMFPNVPDEFCLSPKKLSYLISDALSPYFKQKVKENTRKAFYALMYDETTNAAGMKELQTVIRYWSPTENKVVVQYLETFFIGSATADIIFNKIKEALDKMELPLTNLVMLGSDGPYVNKKVHRLMAEELKVLGKKLVDIGTCNIHIVHNAYLKGIEELGEDASELISAVHRFFDGWPSRWEEFTVVQSREGLKKHKFLKHCSSRWLTLEDSAKRLLEQWPGVIEYFLKYLPTKTSETVTSTHNYRSIVNLLKKPTIKAEIHFVISSAKIFTKFTGIFQKEEPLVHVLHSELCMLIQTLLGRFCKKSVIKEDESEFENLLESSNYLQLKDIHCNSEIQNELKDVKEKDKIIFLRNMQMHYIAACKHLLQKTSLSSSLLKKLKCFHPKERMSKQSCQNILKVAKDLRPDVCEDRLLDEWRMYQVEKDVKNNDRLDAYWSHIFSIKNSSGQMKYSTIAQVAKAALILSHGNADVERGFSTSGRVLTEERASMSERMLNSILTVKSALQAFNNKPQLVPITKELLSYARNAYRQYEDYLKEQKRLNDEKELKKKEDEERKAKELESRKKIVKENELIKQCEDTLKEKRQKEENKRKIADTLFVEATERLKKGVQNNNIEEIRLAEAMLQSVANVRKEEAAEREQGNKVQKALEKRKSTLIDNYIIKKPKIN